MSDNGGECLLSAGAEKGWEGLKKVGSAVNRQSFVRWKMVWPEQAKDQWGRCLELEG